PRRIVVTPYAKKLAKQHKIDLANVAGTGPNGRITASDIENAAGITPVPAPSVTVVAKTEPVRAAAKPMAAQSTVVLPGTTVPFTTMQAAVSRNMVESLAVPTFRVGYSITTDALDALYKK
ncbi:hypothetical protein KI387_025340, partial [Taxus chinensis]